MHTVLFQKFRRMDINFQYDEVRASDRLEIMAGSKLEKLLDKYDFIIRADVLFKKENTASPDTGMICKIRLSVPGPLLFAEASHGSFEAAIAEAVGDVQRQLRRRKEKMQSRT